MSYSEGDRGERDHLSFVPAASPAQTTTDKQTDKDVSVASPGSHAKKLTAYVNANSKPRCKLRNLRCTAAGCKAGSSQEKMDVLWGPPSSRTYLPLLQSPEITVLLTPYLWVVQYFLPYKKTQETGKGGRKGRTNTSCLLEGDNTDTLPCQIPHAKPSAA